MDKVIGKCLLLVLFLSSFSFYAQSRYEKKYVKVEITNRWNADSLRVVQKKLKRDYGIDFSFKNVKLDKKKKIKSLDLYVNCNDGYKGSASFAGNVEGSYFGFYRDYGYFALKYFGVGYIEK